MDTKLGIIHYNFAGSMDDFLAYCRKTGYKYVEIQIGSIWGEGAENNAEDLRKKIDSYDLKVSAVAAGNDFVVIDPKEVKTQVDRVERIASLAHTLGTSTLRMEGGSPKDSVPEPRWIEAMETCLKRCLEQFAERDEILLAVDNHGVVTNDGDLQLELIQRVDSALVGVCLDTMNYRWFGHDLDQVNRYYEILAPYTLHMHLKDGRGSRETYRGEALGEGEIHLKKAVRLLKDSGYNGVWTCEYEGRENDGIGQTKSYQWMVANL